MHESRPVSQNTIPLNDLGGPIQPLKSSQQIHVFCLNLFVNNKTLSREYNFAIVTPATNSRQLNFGEFSPANYSIYREYSNRFCDRNFPVCNTTVKIAKVSCSRKYACSTVNSCCGGGRHLGYALVLSARYPPGMDTTPPNPSSNAHAHSALYNHIRPAYV